MDLRAADGGSEPSRPINRLSRPGVKTDLKAVGVSRRWAVPRRGGRPGRLRLQYRSALLPRPLTSQLRPPLSALSTLRSSAVEELTGICFCAPGILSAARVNHDSLHVNHDARDSDAAAQRRARREQFCGLPVHDCAAVLPTRSAGPRRGRFGLFPTPNPHKDRTNRSMRKHTEQPSVEKTTK